MQPISPNLFVYPDTCQVYMIRMGDQAVLIDFGSGGVLDELPALGIRQVTDILITHHHRDQVQGLAERHPAGARLWVPYNEQDLFHSVDAHWQAREVYLNYNVRQDRFSLLNPVRVDGLLQDYATLRCGTTDFELLPTPGHTPGSISLLTHVDNSRVVFSGDLIHAPGKVWSLAATQWSYNGGEGLPATVASLLSLKERQPDLLLPSHGQPIQPVDAAIDLTVERLVELMHYRQQNPRLLKFIQQPYTAITPHLLRSNQNTANTYVLRSDSGKALLIDFGYDFMTGSAPGSDRAARRPWLYSLPALKRGFGIHSIDVVLPTHYHDDHVAGINLLRQVEGTKSWVPQNFAPILAEPQRFNLPCLWYDPIPADRVLPLEQPVQWEEYTLTLHPLPGHTRYAVAIELAVDGHKVLAVGDQYQNDDGLQWNYVYQNLFSAEDYQFTADLYQRIQPDLILSGHWEPLWVQSGYFDELKSRGQWLQQAHQQLLPEEIRGFGVEGFGACIEPYQSEAQPGAELDFSVLVKNPFERLAHGEVHLVTPAGWMVTPASITLTLAALEHAKALFHLQLPADARGRQVRIAAELSVEGHNFGQQAEALISIAEQPA